MLFCVCFAQLIVAVVSKMGDFLLIFGLAIVGFAFAFMLVFSKEGVMTTDSNNTNTSTAARNSTRAAVGNDDALSFGNVPASLFRSFTTMLGDFDVEEIWEGGSPVMCVFMVATLLGNIVLLNLLIAIVSDEFDRYMERAPIEAQLAMGLLCQEARQVKGLDEAPLLDPKIFPRHMLVLREKREEGPTAVKWTGRVSAVTNVVHARIEELDNKISKNNKNLYKDISENVDGRMGKLETQMGKLETQMGDIDRKLDILLEHLKKP